MLGTGRQFLTMLYLFKDHTISDMAENRILINAINYNMVQDEF